MARVAEVKKIKTYDQLEKFCKDNGIAMEVGISYRGGNLGVYGSDLAEYLNICEGDLPRYYGAYCNYLGGGVRGSIVGSGYNNEVPKRIANWLEEFADACKRVYEYIENEDNLNDDYPDGSTNWDARATKGSRNAGIEIGRASCRERV